MKNIINRASNIASASVLFLLCANAWGQHVLAPGAQPTGVTITNASKSQVFANIVLGQPPAAAPSGCSNLGEQIVSLTDSRLIFSSSVRGKKVKFTPVGGVTDKGAYRMAAGETITYRPKTVSCGTYGKSNCSPAVTVNYFFTPNNTGFSNNNGCSNSAFPDATNLAEVSIRQTQDTHYLLSNPKVNRLNANHSRRQCPVRLTSGVSRSSPRQHSPSRAMMSLSSIRRAARSSSRTPVL